MSATLSAGTHEPFRLSDKYEAVAGRVQLTGIQALARLPIEQHRRDLASGFDVGTLISGYEGSPLGGYDLELARQRRLLDLNDIVFVPGLNEEAAATAVQGSQLVNTFDRAIKHGVLGIWYGKAPGLDRAADAVRHGNLMGAHPRGGALLLIGDDPAAKSSSVPCASEFALMDLEVPFVYPSDSQDILELGRHAVEISRASGLWVGMKIVTAVADGSSTVALGIDGPPPELPHGSGKHEPNSKLLQPTLGVIERDLVTTRLRIAEEYARLNRLNRVVGRGQADSIGIVAAGRTYRETLAALERLGLSAESLPQSPVRLLQVNMPWPMDGATVREFADGLNEIVVVEEKRSFIEAAIRNVLYGSSHCPAVHGKSDPAGNELFPAYGDLDADIIGARLRTRLLAHAIPVTEDTNPHRPAGRTQLQLAPLVTRAPYFCSGCPHNSSTKPHGDDLVGGGIGCHALVLMMSETQVGTVTGLAQMGGEGLQWIGMAPFTDRTHYTQNLGDGTFDHSGSLAIRAAVAAGVNITYRLLFNSAVAMTGGQHAVGAMGVRQIIDVLKAEGVAKIIVTTEDLGRYKRNRLPSDVPVWDRRRLDEAHRVLAEVPGTTVLIHDQECATEKRRKRKRGKLATPETRVFINERICEGCGDCGKKSNCLSVQPVATEYGRKTRIHQASCNVDYSCLEGTCPAFITVTNASTGTADGAATPILDGQDLTDPEPCVPGDAFGVRLTGVGGTGVVTVSQVLATAGLVAGMSVRSLDQTGLAQKGGAVVSDIRFDRRGGTHSNKLGDGECDLYLGFDILVAADPVNLRVASRRRTVAVLNSAEVATGHMVSDVREVFPDVEEAVDRVRDRMRPGVEVVDARTLARDLFGDDQYANLLMVGVGFQRGALPLPATAIEEAIRLNGVAVDRNLQAFRYGRMWVLDAIKVVAAASGPGKNRPGETDTPGDFATLVEQRAAELVAYQDASYAERFRLAVEAVRKAEERTIPGATTLSESVARHLFKLMAYKDEFEVARLAIDPQAEADLCAQFGPHARAHWNLHPPVLRAMGMKGKVRLGPQFRRLFAVLYRLRFLRGTRFDPFGRAHVRVVERELITEYLDLLAAIVDGLTSKNYVIALELVGLPDMVRGYEEVKLRNVEIYRDRMSQLRTQFEILPATLVQAPTTPGHMTT